MTFWEDLLRDADDLDDLDDLDDEDLEELGIESLDPLEGEDEEEEDDDDEEDDDLTGDDLERSVFVNCPYCGREVEHVVDPGGGTHQVYVEDCEVCCQPWEVTVRIEDGIPWAEAKALDD